MTSSPATVFVAYSSRDEETAETIVEGVRHANSVPSPYRFEPWVFNDIPGTPLISPIIEKIDESPFVIADITYLNPNVVYEVGYTIGRRKRAFLIRNSRVEGDKSLANEVGIFDTLGYHSYVGFESLKNRLTSHIEHTAIDFNTELNRKAPVYIVTAQTRTHAETLLISRLKKARFRYRSFNPSEDARLSAIDAIQQVAASAGIVVFLQSQGLAGSDVHNIRSVFVAGLAHAMQKPTLILSPTGYEAPLDIRDAIASYRTPDDIREHIADFCPEINEALQTVDAAQLPASGLLQSLSIGDPTAENEMATLSKYFLRTDEYQRALRGEVNLVVGRKGSGKTALFIQARNRIRSDKRNIVVDLKPEGFQLIKLKEDILKYLSEGARQHLITAFWEYLILLEISYKILEKDRNAYRFNHHIHDLYLELEAAYKSDELSSEGDFSERLLTLSERLTTEYKERFGTGEGRRLTSQQVTELVYKHDIRELRDTISSYLQHKDAVWVLFDNLDKGWSTQGVDVIDAVSLRCLIDAGRKIERSMRRDGHFFRCIIFIRNDVYEHVMGGSADYGKEMRAILDWTDPDLLREMLRLRLVAGLGSDTFRLSFSEIWPKICASHCYGEESSSYIIERSLMRPRNVLKIFNHARGFATNFNREKITEEDIEKGLRSYSQDLIVELDRELTDVFTISQDLLYYFIDAQSLMSRLCLRKLINEAGIGEGDVDRVIEFLLYYGVVGVRTGTADYFIYNVNYDLKQLQIRAQRAGEDVQFVVNPAFWPAFDISGTEDSDEQPTLPL